MNFYFRYAHALAGYFPSCKCEQLNGAWRQGGKRWQNEAYCVQPRPRGHWTACKPTAHGDSFAPVRQKAEMEAAETMGLSPGDIVTGHTICPMRESNREPPPLTCVPCGAPHQPALAMACVESAMLSLMAAVTSNNSRSLICTNSGRTTEPFCASTLFFRLPATRWVSAPW